VKWQIATQIQASLTRGDRMLGLALVPLRDGWMVAAFETPAPPKGAGDADVASGVLAQHAHKMLGEQRTLEEAMDAAEAFASDWEAGLDLDRCGCTEIKP
jgi:hypothetical protein